MAALAAARLAPFGARAEVRQVAGEPRLPVADGGVDRVVAAYVLDLLGDAEIDAILAEARRALGEDGLLCAVSLTEGESGAARFVARAWHGLWRRCPALVGGCRPLRLLPRLSDGWRVEHHAVVVSMLVPSEVVVARRADLSRYRPAAGAIGAASST
jgi:hypothetical protein